MFYSIADDYNEYGRLSMNLRKLNEAHTRLGRVHSFIKDGVEEQRDIFGYKIDIPDELDKSIALITEVINDMTDNKINQQLDVVKKKWWKIKK